jgi:hypothetical protein
MKRINLLGSLGLAALLAGCMVHGSGGAYVSGPTVAVVEVEEEPPPPRVVHYDARPGFVYISGRWTWNGGRWVWADGYYERERVGYVYAPGRWERRGRRHVWVDGRWNAGARVDRAERREGRDEPEVRDHRTQDNGNNGNGQGPIIRDHRR